MTAQRAIEIFDLEKANDIDEKLKITWLSELDKKIVAELNFNRDELDVSVFDENSSLSKKLNAPEAYSEIYIAYLLMRADYYLGEVARYNNSSSIFNRLYYEMANYINRNFKVKTNNSIKVEY